MNTSPLPSAAEADVDAAGAAELAETPMGRPLRDVDHLVVLKDLVVGRQPAERMSSAKRVGVGGCPRVHLARGGLGDGLTQRLGGLRLCARADEVFVGTDIVLARHGLYKLAAEG